VSSVEPAAPSFGVEVIAASVRDTADIEPAIAGLARQPNGGLIFPTDSFALLLIRDLGIAVTHQAAVSTEIGMGFVPISICWHAMNSNLIPGVALRAVLFKGAGNFVWIVAHCCSPSF